MIGDCVISGTHAQASHGTTKVTAKDDDILSCSSIVSRLDERVQVDGRDKGGDGSQEMCVDVDSLVVNVGQRSKGTGKRVAGRSIARVDVVIILLPGRKI